jgi:hypothetical protein
MLVAHGNDADLPGYDAPTVTLMPVGSTSQCSVQELGFTEIGLLTPLRRLYPLPVRRASALLTASFRFHLAMDTLAVQLTLPLAGCVEDFHLQVSAPCRAHQNKGSGLRRTQLQNYQITQLPTSLSDTHLRSDPLRHESLNHVALLYVIEVLQINAALHAVAYFAGIVFEPSE